MPLNPNIKESSLILTNKRKFSIFVIVIMIYIHVMYFGFT